MDPVTANRSSAREAYYDPVQTRTNLELITGNQVTKLIIDSSSGTAVVTGVEVRDILVFSCAATEKN